MILPLLFKEPGTPEMPKTFLSDEVYSKALEAMVVVCADAVIINKKKKTFFLANRISKPMQGWWVIGGRVIRGEDPISAIQRKFEQETGLKIEAEKFEFITFVRHQWKDRQQQPQDRPIDDLTYTFAIELTEQEIDKIKTSLDPKEYASEESLKEFSEAELQNLHPSLSYLYGLIFK